MMLFNHDDQREDIARQEIPAALLQNTAEIIYLPEMII